MSQQKMHVRNSIITCLCEKSFFYGASSLINSLYLAGFYGKFIIGYRGDIPEVVKNELSRFNKDNSKIELRLIELETTLHLTNYKPTFIKRVIKEHLDDDEKYIFYFDPDITIKTPWSYFEEWASNGIALCEDVNSPLTSNHPLINQWKKYLELKGFSFNYQYETYVNGGFIGFNRENFGFLKIWQDVQQAIAPMLDGMKQMNLSGERSSRAFPFSKHDQDALNIAIRCSDLPVSIVGQEGMDFKPGGYIMSHAIGAPKPWEKFFTWEALKGKKPRLADIYFWKYADGQIKVFSKFKLLVHKIDLLIGRVLGRYL